MTHQLLIHEHESTSHHVSPHCCSVSRTTLLNILSNRSTVQSTVSQFYVALSTTFIRHRPRYRVRRVVQTVSFTYKPCVLVFKMHSSSIPKIHHHDTSWAKNLHPVPSSGELFSPQFSPRTSSSSGSFAESYQKLHQREFTQETQPLMSHDNKAVPTTFFFNLFIFSSISILFIFSFCLLFLFLHCIRPCVQFNYIVFTCGPF